MATLKNTNINATGFLKIATGTTAERPASPVSGDFRYNTDNSAIEYYNGSAWVGAGGSAPLGNSSGEAVFSRVGRSTFIVPAGVTAISVVAVGGGGCGDDGNSGDGGGGGGAGGALAYANSVPVTAGQVIDVVVGRGGNDAFGKGTRSEDGLDSTVTIASFVITATGGQGGAAYSTNPGSSGSNPSFSNTPGGVVTGGNRGGNGGPGWNGGGGGGGAGGFTGRGGNGSRSTTNLGSAGDNGQGTGAGGGGAAQDGGTGYSGNSGGGDGGDGQNDATGGGGGGAYVFTDNSGKDGTDGNALTQNYSQGGKGGYPGGGGGGSWDNNTGYAAAGADGIVRIIWGVGITREFPSTNVDQSNSDFVLSL